MLLSVLKALSGKFNIKIYSPSIVYLSAASTINCIVARWPDKRCLSQGMCLYQVMMTFHFLNDVVNDAESSQKSINTSLYI